MKNRTTPNQSMQTGEVYEQPMGVGEVYERPFWIELCIITDVRRSPATDKIVGISALVIKSPIRKRVGRLFHINRPDALAFFLNHNVKFNLQRGKDAA